MILSVEELRQYITTDKEDSVLEGMLLALELAIRKYTNNNFQQRAYRRTADIVGGLFVVDAVTPFVKGDTVQISESEYNEGLYTVSETDDASFKVNERITDEPAVLVTRVHYPADVKMGVVNMIKWDIENRDKVGIQSETLSRHSVTYFNMDSSNTKMGYPVSLLGFLQPYRKARF